jgi:prepilin-type N-terminal cleavage/methylation domain-containing protein
MSTFPRQPRPTNRPEQAGFTLTELAVVLVIIVLLFVFIMPTSTALLNAGKREITRQKLNTIDAALINFVTVNKRLPCPADGTANPGAAGGEGIRWLASDPPPGGFAAGDCRFNQVAGVVPFLAIGLTQADIEDGWDNRITYRVAFGLTRDSALDMFLCDPAGTKTVPATTDTSGTAPPGGRCWATCVGTDMATCTSPRDYLLGKGFDIRNGQNEGAALIMSGAAQTGAAYVLISHGENAFGAYSRDGRYSATPLVGVAGTNEDFNKNGPLVSVTSGVPTSANTFRDTQTSVRSEVLFFFDDMISRPSVFSVIQRAQLGPRSR